MATIPLNVLVIAVLVFEEAARPLYRPLARWLGRLRLIQSLENGVACLPAYAALFVLAVPFALAEPLKIIGLYWMGTGHLGLGLAALVFAYAASFIVVERIYKAGRPKLLSICWFAAGVTFGARLKDTALAYLRANPVWTAAMALKVRLTTPAKEALNRVLRRRVQLGSRLP